jgi:hypothetical protein
MGETNAAASLSWLPHGHREKDGSGMGIRYKIGSFMVSILLVDSSWKEGQRIAAAGKMDGAPFSDRDSKKAVQFPKYGRVSVLCKALTPENT